MNRGFTLVELMVALAIFGIMTALVVAKYGTFNQSVLLTNLAYDTALVIRTAQTYGLSVKSADDLDTEFNYSYGVEFAMADPKSFALFVDNNSNKLYEEETEKISKYNIKRNAVISNICADYRDACESVTDGKIDVMFTRPEPNANICAKFSSSGSQVCGLGYANITLRGTDGSERSVLVRSNGQISVEE